jgi:hypothetical protein
LLIAVLILFFAPQSALPADVTLTWNANNEPDVAGYRVFSRKAEETYDYENPAWEGSETKCEVDGLDTDVTYCFVARAFDTSGLQSTDSNEVCYVPRADTDADGIPDGEENLLCSDPNAFDTDGDGYSDGLETEYDTDPCDIGSAPIPAYKLLAGLDPYPSDGGWIELLNMDYGNESWLRVGWPEYNASNGEARLATGDIDGDGKDEIVIGLGPVPDNPSIPNGLIQILDDDYSHLTWGQIEDDAYNQANGESWPACGDLDGDGDDEIVIGLGEGGHGKVEIFDYVSGDLVHVSWARIDWAAYNEASGQARPACGDIDRDGKDEIVIGLAPVPTDPLVPGGFFEVLDDDCSHMAWGQVERPAYNNTNGESRPACGDLDGDGVDEIVVGLGPGGDGYFEIFDFVADEVVHRAWKQVNLDDPESSYEEIRPICGNLDDDGRDEILIGFGMGGGGWMQVFDDTTAGYDHTASLRILGDDYNASRGGTWPAIKSEGMRTGETTGCSGDLDDDGDVDGTDLRIFSQDFGREDCSNDCPGDLDGDGDVDGADMGLFAAEFGRSDCR